MTDDIDIDGLDNADDLKAVLQSMQSRISDLEGQVSALHNARKHLIEQNDELTEEIEDLRQQLQDVGGHVELVDASLSSPQKGKIEKILAVLDFIDQTASGGTAGVKIGTGEVAAASGASRDTALRLMDEIGARFEWADVENPGGPKPKQLKINTATTADARREDVRTYYAEAES